MKGSKYLDVRHRQGGYLADRFRGNSEGKFGGQVL